MSPEDEVEMVLAALRELQRKVFSPIIRACIESAHGDIVHLVGGGEDADAGADEPPCSTP